MFYFIIYYLYTLVPIQKGKYLSKRLRTHSFQEIYPDVEISVYRKIATSAKKSINRSEIVIKYTKEKETPIKVYITSQDQLQENMMD